MLKYSEKRAQKTNPSLGFDTTVFAGITNSTYARLYGQNKYYTDAYKNPKRPNVVRLLISPQQSNR